VTATYEHIDRTKGQRWFVEVSRAEMLIHFAAKAIGRQEFGIWRQIGKGCDRLIVAGWSPTDGSSE
jgi:hypothetical protein